MKNNIREPFQQRTKLLFTQIVRRWFWILPLFLSLLPYFSLKWQIAQVKKDNDAISDSRWMQDTSFITDEINEASTEGYWASEVARRFTVGIQRSYADKNQLLKYIKNFKNTCKLKELPEYSISFVRLASNTEPLFVKHVTSSVIPSYFCKKLFQAMIRSFDGKSSELSSAKWQKRLTALFGYSIYEYFFSLKMRMQSFLAIMQEQNVHVVWNIVKHHNKIVGAFILKMNAFHTDNDERFAINATLANWKSKETFPVFLSLPTAIGGARVSRKIKYGKNIKAVQEIVGDIQQEMKVIPAGSSNMVGYNNLPNLATSSAIAHVNLPVYLAGVATRHRLSKWRYRVFSLKPEAAYLGILFNRIQPQKKNFLEILSWLWLLGIFSGWLLFFTRWAIFKKPITFGIRATLFLWCFGLMATPIFLGIGAEYNFLSTYARNFQSDLFKKTKNSLERIDAESRKLLKQQEEACDYLVSSQQLFKDLLKVQQNKGAGKKQLIDSVWKNIYKQNIDLNYLGIVGHQGFYVGKNDGVVILQSNDFVPGILAKRWLDFLEGGNKPNLDGIPKLEISLPNVKSSYGSWPENVRVKASSRAGTARIWLGEMINIYRRNITHNGKDWYYLGFIWDQKKSFKTYLTNELTKKSQSLGLMRIAAYFGTTENRALVVAKNHGVFTELNSRSEMQFVKHSGNSNRQELINIEGQECLRLTFACKAMPNFVIVATVSLEQIRGNIQEEVLWNIAFLLLTIVLVVIFVLFLSARLANPLVEISKNLMSISSGNLEVKFNDMRKDEIGTVTNSLNSMTLSLKERKKLSEFVAPDVLKAVTSGDLSFKASGNSREASILVSDIRNFTTMSEAYSAEDMFLLLNNHLGAMTSIIQSYSGVIDRFVGDAVVAVFYKDDTLDYIENALLASKEMMIEHAKVNEIRENNGLFTYKIGIGIDAGELLTGVLGDEEVRLDYSILGNSVQRANQLEALSKLGKASRIIVSDRIKASLSKKFDFIEIKGHKDAWEFNENILARKIISSNDRIATASSKSEMNLVGSKVNPSIDTNIELFDNSPDTGNTNALPVQIDIVSWFYRLSFWLLPVALILLVAIYLNNVEAKHSARKQKSEMLRVTKHITNTSNPETQLSIILRKKIHLLSSMKGPFESRREKITKKISDYATELRQFIPNISWRFYTFKDTGGYNEPVLEKEDLSPSFALSSNIFNEQKKGEDIAKNCRSYFLDRLVRVSALRYLPKLYERNLVRNNADYNFKASIEDTHGTFHTIFDGSSSVNLFWEPILKSRSKRNSGNELWKFDMFANSKNISKLFLELRENIEGIVQFILPKRRISFADTMPLMIKSEIPSSMYAGFIRETDNLNKSNKLDKLDQSGQFIPDFFKQHSEILDKVKQARHGVTIFDGWFISTKNINADKVYKFFIVKKIQDSKLSKNTHVLILIAFSWFLGGLIVLFSGLRMQLFSRISTFLTLSIGFIVIMLPAFFFGMVSIERFIFEKKIAIEANKQDDVALSLSRIDKSFDVYNSWATSVFDKITQSKKLLSVFDKGSQLTDRQPHLWIEFLHEMKKSLCRMGLFTSSLVLMSPDGKYAHGDLKNGKRNHNNGEMQSWLRSQMLTTSLWGKLTKNMQKKLSSTKSKNHRMLIGSEIDKLRSAIIFLIGKSVFNKYLLAPISFSFWQTNFSDKEYIINKVVWHDNKVRYCISMNWDIPSLGIHFLRSLDNIPAQFDIKKMNVAAAQSQDYNWLYTQPYIHFGKDQPTDSVVRVRLYRLPDFDTQLLHFRGVNSEASISSFNGTGINRKLSTVYLTKVLPVMLLNVTSDIGKLYRLLDAQQIEYRNYVLIFLILVFFLSRLVARRFVKPINELLKATNRVSRGDFSVRLPNSWEHEFGLISNSFNSMALEAEEGRLIGKFVSESVKTVVKSEKDEQKALVGTKIQGVILFTGLAEFKDDLPNMPSAKLFSDLNIYLKAMSRIIRSHNGEIDKFIGDKILAVFHSDEENNLDTAKSQAVKASLAMQDYMREHVNELSYTLGIGIVPGQLLAGIMGTELVRLEYTVIGDTVNLAARLSDLATKQDDGCIVVESGIIEVLHEHNNFSNVSIDKMDTNSVKGKKREVTVFKIQYKKNPGTWPGLKNKEANKSINPFGRS